MKNRYGVDVDYFDGCLNILLRDIKDMTKNELCRNLLALAYVATDDEDIGDNIQKIRNNIIDE